ncbi:MAG: hypothetical protein JXM71_00675 [Spirochaetales bacterium]|nr:hypothetical protein [Spirochaetales bacterium]
MHQEYPEEPPDVCQGKSKAEHDEQDVRLAMKDQRQNMMNKIEEDEQDEAYGVMFLFPLPNSLLLLPSYSLILFVIFYFFFSVSPRLRGHIRQKFCAKKRQMQNKMNKMKEDKQD